MYQFNTESALKQLLDLLNPIAKAVTAYPSKDARFPLVIVNDPLQRPKQLQGKIDLQFSIEVWHNSMFEAIRTFDQVTVALYSLNIRLANNTTNFKDPLSDKWRKGGTFEVRYNAVTNQYEINR